MEIDDESWEKWTIEELEHQMSPSQWNPNKTPQEVINQFISRCTEESEKARKELQYEANIMYGTKTRQKYDLYGTDLSEKAPIFFWIHGGYWQEGSKDMSAQMALNLHEIGVKTLVLGYTLAPEATVSQIKFEFYAALNHAMRRYPKANFFIGGNSAGGHLSACLLHEDSKELVELDVSRILGFLLFGGVFDLRLLVGTTINHPLKLTREDATSLSPLLLPFNSNKLLKHIQVLVLVGGLETPEFQRQSRVYGIKLHQNFQHVVLCVSPEDDHFTLAENMSDMSPGTSGKTIRDFISNTLKNSENLFEQTTKPYER